MTRTQAVASERDLSEAIESMRAWLIVNVWGERRGAEYWVPTCPAMSVLRGITRHYPGGIDAYVSEHFA